MYTRLTHGIFMPCNTAFDLWCWMFICCCYGYFILFHNSLFILFCSGFCLFFTLFFVRQADGASGGERRGCRSFVFWTTQLSMNTQAYIRSVYVLKILSNKTEETTKRKANKRFFCLLMLLLLLLLLLLLAVVVVMMVVVALPPSWPTSSPPPSLMM